MAGFRGLVVGLLGVALGLIAQALLERGRWTWEAGGLFLFAGVVFTCAARGTLAPLHDAAPALLPPILSRGAKPRGALLVLSLAVLLNVVGVIVFATHGDPNLAWLAYLVSLPVGLTGVYWLDGRPSLIRVLRRNRGATLAVLGLLGIALAVRVYQLGDLPFGLWADESMSGLEVMHIMRDPSYRPIIGTGPSQGLPSYLWYLTVPLFALLGPNELALRLPTAIMGALGVVAVFLLGRALLGTLYGLVACAVLATLSWDVTFSRIAMNGVHSTLFDAASLAFLLVATRTGRRSVFALAGLCLGLSQNFYFAGRLFVLIPAIYLLHQLLIQRLRFARGHLTGLVLFGLFALLASSPITLVALENPREFNERAATVTVFKEIQQAGSYQPLYDNIRKHLLMFNYRGDANGRHNLPDAPMLETITAALAVLGLVLAVARLRRPEFAVPVVWWLVMLQGGIWSLAFEAPQAYRTIDLVVAVALLVALPITALAERMRAIADRARGSLHGRPVPLGAVAATALATTILGPLAHENLERYFVLQASSFPVWAAHATPQTLIGRELHAGETVGNVYYDPVYLEHPTIRFLAPEAPPHVRFDPVGVLPVRDEVGATVFLSVEQASDLATIRRLYPGATIKEHRAPSNGETILYEAIIPPALADEVRGADLRVWNGKEEVGEPTARARVRSIDLAPDSTPIRPPLSANWRAVFTAPAFGTYGFKLDAPSDASLRLDETELTASGGEAGVTLAKGSHTLELRASISAPAPVRLLWRTPGETEYVPVPENVLFTGTVTNNGLLGSYYSGPSWSGEPRIQQIDPGLQIRVHLVPLERPYSVEWRGKIYIPSTGQYRFGTASRDGSWLYLDEELLVDHTDGSGDYVEAGLSLTQGFHDVRIRFLDQTGSTFINVFWTPPGGGREPLPEELLFPPQGSYPDKAVPPPTLVTSTRPAATGRAVLTAPGLPANAPRIPLVATQTLGGHGTALGQFDQPRAAALDRNGNLYVADTANRRVQKFNPAGQAVASWGDLVEPLGIVVDSGGRVVVLDSEPGWLKRYSPDGTQIGQFGGPDTSFYHPRGLAIDEFDNLYVADTGGGRVVKYDANGDKVAVIGIRGQGPGEILEPTGVAVDRTGVIWVADTAGSKLVRYARDGSPDLELRLPAADSFNGVHLAVARDGSLVLTDPEAARLIVLGPDATLRGVVQDEGLGKPVGVSIGPDGRIVVDDVEQHQVSILVLGPPT